MPLILAHTMSWVSSYMPVVSSGAIFPRAGVIVRASSSIWSGTCFLTVTASKNTTNLLRLRMALRLFLVGLSGNMGFGHQHRPQLQQDHGPRHGLSNNSRLNDTMVLEGNRGHPDQHGPTGSMTPNTNMTLDGSTFFRHPHNNNRVH